MVASLRGSGGTVTKEDELNTGRVLAAGFHHVTAHSRLARLFYTYEPFISLIFQIFSGRGQPRIRRSTCIHDGRPQSNCGSYHHEEFKCINECSDMEVFYFCQTNIWKWQSSRFDLSTVLVHVDYPFEFSI